MSKFIINGGHPLKGEFTPVGNKNAALPMLAAALLTSEPIKLTNLPLIEDVNVMLELLADLGADIRLRGHTATIQATDVNKTKLDAKLCARVRSSILLAGPLLARHGGISMSPPGGDIIGRRRLDTHFLALKALGARISGTRTFSLRSQCLKGTDIILDEASVTATENAMMAAVLARGRTTIFNAACEPHVKDLGRLLEKMGARIEGLGTNLLTIHGVKKLNGASHRIESDYIEVGSFLAAAAATRGSLTTKGMTCQDSLRVLERVFQRLGVRWTTDKNTIRLSSRQSLTIEQDFSARMPKIEDGIWPGFPSDLMSVAIVLASQTDGNVLFFEKLFESRMYFVDHLIGMGAEIVQCDPHRVVVAGPSQLRGSHMASPDIRAGMGLIVAALCAKGQSTIENAEIIDRGYERIDERLRQLGADITRIN